MVEPNNPYIHGWHIEAICLHLEAITFGRFLAKGLDNRFLANVPPGTMKSLIVSVFWPAWEWTINPTLTYICTSYSDDIVTRDSRRMMMLVTSDWYQTLWSLKLTTKGIYYWENERGGHRRCVAFASLTGFRADRIIIDDPHSVKTAESETEREHAKFIFRESIPNRWNHPTKSAVVIIMQRLHSDDISGQIEQLKLPYVKLILPMEFEIERQCETPFFIDPRTYDGELLFPERFPRAVLDRDYQVLGSYAVAGQYQQRPTAREGGMFKRHWFENKRTRVIPSPIVKVFRHWDLAATKKKKSPRSVGVKMALMLNAQYIVLHVEVLKEEGDVVRKSIKAIAERDGKRVPVRVPQDPGQAGKVQGKDYVALLAGWDARAIIESGDKAVRAEPYSAQCEAGHVWLYEGEDEGGGHWINDYLDELCLFPGGTYKDQVDASSGAFGDLVEGVIINSDFGAPKVIHG